MFLMLSDKILIEEKKSFVFMSIHILLWRKPSPKPATGHNAETKD